MLRKNHHIIQRQNIEINFENFSDGIGIQNEISDLFRERLLPKMEMLFDDIASEKYLITVEDMEIDCGLLTPKNWENELIDQAILQLKNELSAAYKKEIKADDVEQDRLTDTFLFFIEQGHLPWNSLVHSIKELEEIEIDKSFLEKLKALINAESKASERLLYSFSEYLFNKIIQLLAESKNEKIKEATSFLLHEISKPDLYNKKKVQLRVLKIFSDNEENAEQSLQSLLNNETWKIQEETIEPSKGHEQIISNEENAQTIKANESDQYQVKANKNRHNKNSKSKSAVKEIYIQNAGLVILHPFLQELFTRLELIKNMQWIDIELQNVAVHILEYLVSGNDEAPEFHLLLNKIMCGLDMSEVLLPTEKLSDKIKLECDELLAEVIQHWSKLKKTSIETLRETFLQRNGKLTKIESGWLLNVEQKGVDILLNSLPWGIGTIKLPWAKDKIHVEWV